MMSIRQSSIVAVALLWSSVARASTTTPAYALVVGFNESEDDTADNLRYADDDAIATHRLLTEAGVRSTLLTRLDADSRHLHGDVRVDGPPTPAGLREQFENIRAAMSAGTKAEFFFFYSGHGNVEHGEGYVVLDGGRFTRRELYELLQRSPARRNHVVVDACKSYFLAFGKGPGGRRTARRWSATESSSREVLDRTGFVLSTSSARDSHEWERFNAGVFSHEVRSALWGAADLDRDAQITYGELGAFLQKVNSSIRHAQYRPDYIVRPPGRYAGDLKNTILHWRNRDDVLSVRSPGETGYGHLYIEDGAGVRLADLHPARGIRLLVALPARRPLFVRRSDGSREWAISGRGISSLTDQGETIAPVGSRGGLHLAFESLFELPFSPADIEAYVREHASGADPFGKTAIRSDVGTLQGTREQARRATVRASLGALVTGGAMSLVALQLRANGRNKSNRRQTEINRQIRGLNAGAVVFYSLAGAAAATWAILELWPGSAPGIVASPTNGGALVILSRSLQLGN